MEIKNGQLLPTAQIEVDTYAVFYDKMIRLSEAQSNHCLCYFAKPQGDSFKLFAFIANDATHSIEALAATVKNGEVLRSLTAERPALHTFEREMHEAWGIEFIGHPWLKPLRYSHDRAQCNSIYDYPFFNIESEEFHRVGVGPIHAGIIEPGHFRFICEGEKIHHLEIQLGWQHRGVEKLMTSLAKPLQLATLSENIAGDTVVGHACTFAQTVEALAGIEVDEQLKLERTIALEQERIAIHTGDLSAICTDVAYQLGSAVFGRLRTPMINFFQKWCGNRFAKGLIRPGKTNFHFTKALTDDWQKTIDAYKPHFREMADLTFDLPSVLSRIERTGIVSTELAQNIGLVGMAAKASGLKRDVRASHPSLVYAQLGVDPVVQTSGDVYARAKMRRDEIEQSIDLIEKLIPKVADNISDQYEPMPQLTFEPNSTVITMVEGWRGMICHVAQSDANGQLETYKIVDPSVHNWLGLAMAVRGNGISDFPICNKSFDLSYCGHDL